MRIGKFVIWIGLTFGMLALIVWIITQVVNFTGISLGAQVDALLAQIYGLFTYNTGFAFTGVAFAVIGKASVKKVEKQPKESEQIESSTESSFDNLKNKYCPECGAILPVEANFCSQCGTTF
jgi:ribosomal protein L40E